MIKSALVALLGALLSVCATPAERAERAAWTSDWNARLDTMKTDFDHPCATKPFIAWADAFLVGCERDDPEATPECEARNDWVSARVEQCREWTAWQLRNFGKHERVGGDPPSMRIE